MSSGGDVRRRAVISLMVLALVAGGASAALAGVTGGAASPRLARILPGSVTRLLSVATKLGAVSSTAKLSIELPLVLPHQAALNTFAADEYTPGNSNYRHFLTPAQFGARFGAPSAEVSQAQGALSALGLTATVSGANHLYLKVTASVGSLERVFGTTIDHFRLGGHALLSGREFYANVSQIKLPASLDGLVSGVIGLNDADVPQSTLKVDPAGANAAKVVAKASPHALTLPTNGVSGGATPCGSAILGAGYTAPALAAGYNFNGMYAAGYHGENMTVALVEFDDFHDSNVATTESCYKLTTPVTHRYVDGGVGGAPAAGEGEDMADISTILEMLPDLKHLYVYVAPISGTASVPNDGGSEIDLYSDFVTDDVAPILSSSWGNCEQLQSQSYDDLLDTITEEAATQGQQIYDAAGDSGAVDCRGYPTPISGSISVEQESAIPWVTGVGGTDLGQEATVGGPHDEDTWNDNGAGGGGQSAAWTMPSWQKAYLTATGDKPAGLVADCGASANQPCRMVPDISLDADEAAGGAVGTGGPTPPQFFPTDVGSAGYSIYCGTPNCSLVGGLTGLPITPPNGTGGATGWEPIGGTSLATPLAASAAVLWDEEAKAKGLSDLGFLNPSFYRIASNPTKYASDFYDVTSDTNDDQYDSSDCPTGCNPKHLYAAGTGYDMASGLGSINVANLGTDLVADAGSIDVTPDHEDMYGYTTGGASTTQPVSITSGYYGSTYTATSSAAWLKVTGTGKVPGTLGWSVNPTGLTAGSYAGTITVTGAGGNTGTLTVDYTVTPKATMSLSDTAITFNEPAIDSSGSPTTATCGSTVWNDELKDDGLNSSSSDSAPVAATSKHTLVIKNTGPAGSVLHYEVFLVTPTSAWLSTDLVPGGNATAFQTGAAQPLVASEGALASGSSASVPLVSLGNGNALGGYPRLNQGTYDGEVQVRDMANTSLITTIPTTMVLGTGQGTPTIATTPTALTATLAPGGSTTADLSLSDSSGTCGYAYSLSTNQAWATVNPFLQSGTVPVPAATAQPASFNDTGSGNGFIPVDISAAGLAAGTYKGQVTIVSENANTNPTVVPITLTVTGATAVQPPTKTPGKPKVKECLKPGARITLAQHPHKPVREITAVLSINGKVVSRLHAHAIRKVSFKRPKGNRYSFKLVVTLSDGEVISRTVTYTGCKSSKPKLKVLHKVRHTTKRKK